MTFSIVGHCKHSGMHGIAITTSSICVGSRCPWVRAGVGAVTSQNITDPSIGNEVLDLLESGSTAVTAVQAVMSDRLHSSYRQVAVVDSSGNTAHFTGSKILGAHAVSEGLDCVSAGNLLRSTLVPTQMVNKFELGSSLHLGERLLCALEAGVEAGGELGPTHSAALLVAHKMTWPLVDLRIDWSDDPVTELRICWEEYEPQMLDYLARAIDPLSAPTYGVPGDP